MTVEHDITPAPVARKGQGVTVICERITHLYQAGDEQVVALRDVDLRIPAGTSIAL
jgi:hypothetical protein